jgi:hypothetical protein
MTDERGGSGRFEKVVSIVALVVAILAVVFSWQANSIAREANELANRQVSDQIVVLSSLPGSAYFKPGSQNANLAGCENDIRLANLGGAPTQIVGIRARLYFEEVEYEIESTGSLAPEALPYTENVISPILGDFSVYVMASDGYRGPLMDERFINTDELLAIPYQVDAFTTLDLTNRIFLSVDESAHWTPHTSSNVQTLVDSPQLIESMSPLEILVAYKLASGNEVLAPRFTCFYLER